MITDPLLQNTFQKLPQPFTITSSQIRSYYQSLYTKLHESFISDDFSRINNLLSLTSTNAVVPDLKYPPPEDNPSGDTVLIDLVKLLYDIITINPIKYYKSQYLAAVFLRGILRQNQVIDGLTLESQRYYKYLKEIEKSMYFLIPKLKNNIKSILISLSFELKQYFHEENDVIDKASKKFFIKSKFEFYDMFYSNYKGTYKPYINFIISLLNKKAYEPVISTTLIDIFQNNIEDDFSFFLPKLKQLIVMKIIMNKPKVERSIISYISDMASTLFISPPTRNGIIDIFENIFQSLKSLSHHSKSASNYVFSFIDSFIFYLKINLNNLVSDIPNKKIFNMKVELGPSQEEIQ